MRVSKRQGEICSGESMVSAGDDGGAEKALGFPVT
jgi:hypothetical protein